jgi:hypothetical protein
MSNARDHNQPRLVVDGVHDPIIADPDPEIVTACEPDR